MSTSTEQKSNIAWHDIVVSFLPPERRNGEVKERVLAYRLPAIMALQAGLTLRLNDITSNDEALYIEAGHVGVSHLASGSAATEALLRFYGSFFSGAPNLYPLVAGALDMTGGLVLTRIFSLFLMLAATLCVHRIGRYLYSENVGLLAALVFILTGSVQYIGNYATFDAPCLALVAAAGAIGITRRGVSSAALAGALLALATATKYAGLALVPFTLLLIFLTTLTAGGRGQRSFLRAVLRGGAAALAFGGCLLVGYRLWGSGIAGGVKFTTTSRHALDWAPTWYLLESLAFDVGLAFLLALGAILLMLSRRDLGKAAILATMLMGGSVIQASSVRIHEFTSLDKHTAFSGLFLAVPAAVTLQWAFSKRGRMAIGAIVIIWLLFINGMWRSSYEYSWPSSILNPVKEIQSLNVSGEYFSFNSETAAYYSSSDQGVAWYPSGSAFAIFESGSIQEVETAEKSHKFTGFLFEPTDLSAQYQGELKVFDQLLAADPYYFETGTYSVSPYTKEKWQLWIHYPPGYHGSSAKKS